MVRRANACPSCADARPRRAAPPPARPRRNRRRSMTAMVRQMRPSAIQIGDLNADMVDVGAAAQEDLDFGGANIDHVSIQVADLQRSVDFYQKMFGFSVISQDQPLGIIRLGTTRSLVSLNRQSPAGIVDHFAIGVPRFSKESAARYLKQRNGTPEDDPYAGLHIKDPDGINVQIFSQR